MIKFGLSLREQQRTVVWKEELLEDYEVWVKGGAVGSVPM